MSRVLVLASSNPGKIAEFQRLLPDDTEIQLSGDLGITLPAETGRTFKENALMKAGAAAAATGHIAIGDDSGLEVDALNGLPGVRSARYAGEYASDQENIARLISAMASVPAHERTARFRCVIAVAVPGGSTHVAEGQATGIIGYEPHGVNGFGYDPVFIVAGGRAFAELSTEEKDAISHRGAALRAIGPELELILGRQHRYTGMR